MLRECARGYGIFVLKSSRLFFSYFYCQSSSPSPLFIEVSDIFLPHSTLSSAILCQWAYKKILTFLTSPRVRRRAAAGTQACLPHEPLRAASPRLWHHLSELRSSVHSRRRVVHCRCRGRSQSSSCTSARFWNFLAPSRWINGCARLVILCAISHRPLSPMTTGTSAYDNMHMPIAITDLREMPKKEPQKPEWNAEQSPYETCKHQDRFLYTMFAEFKRRGCSNRNECAPHKW